MKCQIWGCTVFSCPVSGQFLLSPVPSGTQDTPSTLEVTHSQGLVHAAAQPLCGQQMGVLLSGMSPRSQVECSFGTSVSTEPREFPGPDRSLPPVAFHLRNCGGRDSSSN